MCLLLVCCRVSVSRSRRNSELQFGEKVHLFTFIRLQFETFRLEFVSLIHRTWI